MAEDGKAKSSKRGKRGNEQAPSVPITADRPIRALRASRQQNPTDSTSRRQQCVASVADTPILRCGDAFSLSDQHGQSFQASSASDKGNGLCGQFISSL